MGQFLSYLLIIMVLVAFAQISMKYAKSYHFYIKKFLHISAILMCAHATIYLPTLPLFFIVIVAFIALIIAIFFGFLADPITLEKEWGVVYFAGVYVLMLCCVLYRNQQEFQVAAAYALTILAISDGFAGIIGRALSNRKQQKISIQGLDNNATKRVVKEKSMYGFTAFVVSSFLIVAYFLYEFTGYSNTEVWVAAMVVSMLLAVTEYLSVRGTDNLTVTIFAFLLIHWLRSNSFSGAFLFTDREFFLLILLSILLLFIVIKLRFLTFSGSLLAWLLAFAVLILSKQSLLPLLFFLVVGSLLGKLPVREIVSDDRFHKPRNAFQVFANGGVVLILGLCQWGLGLLDSLILTAMEMEKLMLVSVAICMADTASSELGSRFGGRPRDILTWQPLHPGVSGGVSWLGTIVGFFGSLLLISIGAYQISMSIYEFISFVLLGFTGMLLDSYLGSKFQYKVAIHGQWVDANSDDLGREYKGLKLITNNSVNFTSNALIIFLLFLFFLCF